VDDGGVTQIPLFPLRSVLCPGVALPLHIFEERYRRMVDRCLARGEPFGVVLLRSGREVGPFDGAIAQVGTTAAIRRAGRYPDGRFDILTVGQQRFQLEAIDSVSEPYLVGRVRFLDEPVGSHDAAHRHAERVGQRFLEYLRLLQPADDEGPEIEIEFEIEVDDADPDAGSLDAIAGSPDPTTGTDPTMGPEPASHERGGSAETQGGPGEALARADGSLPFDLDETLLASGDAADLSPEQRRELLMAAAQRLLATDDPTALSYVLTALVQVDLAARQALLEAPTTTARLLDLERLLVRETWFLQQDLRPIIVDAAGLGRRVG
jgi:Lon protease-like protein